MCIIGGSLLRLGTTIEIHSGEESVATQEIGLDKLSPKMLALLLVGGSLGAIIMSAVSYFLLIGRH